MGYASTARHNLPFLSTGQAQKELTHNEALVLIDAGLQPVAESVGLNVPPVSPAPGRCWLVGDAPTGVWEEHAGALACWTPNGWRFLAAHDGMRVWLTSVQLWAERVAGTWRVGAITGTSLTINGQSVVGPRLGPVGVPSGGSVVDVEARSAIATLIARLQAHGLISS